MQTILVCDDDKEIVEAIEIYLQQEGFHVLKAYDGEEALEILKNNEVHLLIMDVMMPKLDGIRATLKIRENSSIPIIILSAKTEDSDKILGLNIGADDYVEKPFNPLNMDEKGNEKIMADEDIGREGSSTDSRDAVEEKELPETADRIHKPSILERLKQEKAQQNTAEQPPVQKAAKKKHEQEL